MNRECNSVCSCLYDTEIGANIVDCSNSNLKELPRRVPLGTNWINMTNNLLKDLCVPYIYDENVTTLILAFNNIEEICPLFFINNRPQSFQYELDLSANKLSVVPPELLKINNFKIWLGNNPFLCNCDMLWMISWLANATLPSGEHIVADYKNVTCSNGIYKGNQIFKLNRVDMGCYPHRMPSWEIALLAIVGILLVTFCVIMFLVFKRWNEVKFWMYKHFDILDKRDKDEDLEGIKFDALLSYRYQYLGDSSSALCLIATSPSPSLSRSFTSSCWYRFQMA